MDLKQLNETAKKLVEPGRGILAADESTGTMGKRLKDIGVENTEANRIGYRGAVFSAQGGERYISGVILYDETLRQKVDGTPVPEFLNNKGIIPGIKVDKGAKPLALAENEKITEGLDGLRDRLKEYYDLGARFAKWRAVITIGEDIPSDYCLEANADALARYAALCQEQKIVPIVEPEVLMDGTHTIERSYDVTERTLHKVFDALHHHRVAPEGILLKPNMVLSGYEAERQAGVEEVARATLKCFYRTVPAAVPGIVFLSGGQSDEDATAHLDAMNKMGPHPWQLSFSYGRALQQSALRAWAGKAENKEKAQKAFLHRAKLNSAATKGEYKPEMEKELTA